MRRTKVPNLWSLQEIRRLRELADAGVPLDLIAAALRRTRSAIKNKAGFHAIPLRGVIGRPPLPHCPGEVVADIQVID